MGTYLWRMLTSSNQRWEAHPPQQLRRVCETAFIFQYWPRLFPLRSLCYFLQTLTFGAMVWNFAFASCRNITRMHSFPSDPQVVADESRSLNSNTLLCTFAVSIFHETALLTACLALRAPALGITGAGVNSSNWYSSGPPWSSNHNVYFSGFAQETTNKKFLWNRSKFAWIANNAGSN